MQRNNVPAISLAIVRGGHLAYLKAYGDAQLATPAKSSAAVYPSRMATTATRFAIGSVSKQFTAAVILLLADRGRLSLDDPVSKYLPNLTEAAHVTIRQLLSHTSGYRDYFLQEYIPAQMQHPTTVDLILKTWAERPLDFAPGDDWQYSGTNYVIAGRIVEKVTGESFEDFLNGNILRPVGITDATFADHPSPSVLNAVGYYRFALGPPRPAPLTGRNWLFAMANLEMTAKDVALWDISIIDQSLLSHAAYRAMESEILTNRGAQTGYGLGFFIQKVHGIDGREHKLLQHPGEISGFRSANFVLPDLAAAVVILTNAEYSSTPNELAQQLQGIVGVTSTVESASSVPITSNSPTALHHENAVESRAHRLMLDLARGVVDRSELSPDTTAAFTAQAIDDIRHSLAPLGDPQRVTLDSTKFRGGTKHFALTVSYEHRNLQIAEYDLPDGKVEQFMIDDKP